MTTWKKNWAKISSRKCTYSRTKIDLGLHKRSFASTFASTLLVPLLFLFPKTLPKKKKKKRADRFITQPLTWEYATSYIYTARNKECRVMEESRPALSKNEKKNRIFLFEPFKETKLYHCDHRLIRSYVKSRKQLIKRTKNLDKSWKSKMLWFTGVFYFYLTFLFPSSVERTKCKTKPNSELKKKKRYLNLSWVKAVIEIQMNKIKKLNLLRWINWLLTTRSLWQVLIHLICTMQIS